MNQVELQATIVERQAMRYTPAGLPALDLILHHEGVAIECQQTRQVKLDIRAVVIGELATRVERLSLGTLVRALGFLGAMRHGRGVILHITELSEPTPTSDI